ncbi:Major facilitator superfamily domain, general substrate transporter [Niveomyces insectorum RCEF 264]|uniref:Major facilitator superfamily domain, general substrate transporter n=1 Tax=Niveomyces insectorum RCEF 264 TaxID=1081102 RepID=A0A167NSN4_9HYPO|nr:Major facilitator superfamily domain, general substrate transporter [Niveomyces insectorum RCEF 264]
MEKPDDVDIAEVLDAETEHQAHLGVEEQATPEELERERKLVRKIDWHIVPLLMVTYGLQYSDKITLSSAVAFDLKQDTHLVGNDFAWLSTGFYLAYLIAEFPFGYVMQKFRMEKVLGFTVLGWGICVFGLAACRNFTQLMAVRALLGILEAPINPGFLIIVTAWYKREEQVMRSMAFFAMNSFFSLFILMINYGIGSAAYSVFEGSSNPSAKLERIWFASRGARRSHRGSRKGSPSSPISLEKGMDKKAGRDMAGCCRLGMRCVASIGP